MEDNFYQYQRQRLLILLGWGLVNVSGGVGALVKNKFWRQFWLQCFSWGAIDALIAFFGRGSAARKLARYPALAQNPNLPAPVKKEIRNFHRILLINTFLDVGYVLSGEIIRRKGRSAGKAEREGMGVGFMVQGLFLFVFDALLTLEMRRRWLEKAR